MPLDVRLTDRTPLSYVYIYLQACTTSPTRAPSRTTRSWRCTRSTSTPPTPGPTSRCATHRTLVVMYLPCMMGNGPPFFVSAGVCIHHTRMHARTRQRTTPIIKQTKKNRSRSRTRSWRRGGPTTCWTPPSSSRRCRMCTSPRSTRPARRWVNIDGQ